MTTELCGLACNVLYCLKGDKEVVDQCSVSDLMLYPIYKYCSLGQRCVSNITTPPHISYVHSRSTILGMFQVWTTVYTWFKYDQGRFSVHHVTPGVCLQNKKYYNLQVGARASTHRFRETMCGGRHAYLNFFFFVLFFCSDFPVKVAGTRWVCVPDWTVACS